MKYIFAFFIGLFLTPTYFNLFTIYAMVNLHDVSWGNREGGGAEGESYKELQIFRAKWFCFYICSNIVYAYLIIVFASNTYNEEPSAF